MKFLMRMKKIVLGDSWMNEKPGLIWTMKFLMRMKKVVLGDSWMNEKPGLIWTMKFFMRMKKRTLGLMDEWMNTWLDLESLKKRVLGFFFFEEWV